jgi:hypothetical protein
MPLFLKSPRFSIAFDRKWRMSTVLAFVTRCYYGLLSTDVTFLSDGQPVDFSFTVQEFCSHFVPLIEIRPQNSNFLTVTLKFETDLTTEPLPFIFPVTETIAGLISRISVTTEAPEFLIRLSDIQDEVLPDEFRISNLYKTTIVVRFVSKIVHYKIHKSDNVSWIELNSPGNVVTFLNHPDVRRQVGEICVVLLNDKELPSNFNLVRLLTNPEKCVTVMRAKNIELKWDKQTVKCIVKETTTVMEQLEELERKFPYLRFTGINNLDLVANFFQTTQRNFKVIVEEKLIQVKVLSSWGERSFPVRSKTTFEDLFEIMRRTRADESIPTARSVQFFCVNQQFQLTDLVLSASKLITICRLQCILLIHQDVSLL